VRLPVKGRPWDSVADPKLDLRDRTRVGRNEAFQGNALLAVAIF
jgi:hypothetical protein